MFNGKKIEILGSRIEAMNETLRDELLFLRKQNQDLLDKFLSFNNEAFWAHKQAKIAESPTPKVDVDQSVQEDMSKIFGGE